MTVKAIDGLQLRGVRLAASFTIVLAVIGWSETSVPSWAAVTIEKIVESGAPYPGGGTFNAIGKGALDDGQLYFFGRPLSVGRMGLFSQSIGGTPRLLVDTSLAVPNGTGNFYDITTVEIDAAEGSVLFTNRSQNNADFGAYLRNASGSITRVADRSTSVPGSASTFAFFYDLEQAGPDKSYFLASGSGGERGIYAFDGGTIAKVVDKTTSIPQQNSLLFASLESFDLRDGLMTFAGSSGSYRGVFATEDNGQTIDVVADNQTPMPNYAGWNFDFLGSPLTNGDDVIFYGRSARDPNNNDFRMEGIYGCIDGALQVLVDLTTLNPRGGAPGAGGGFGKIDSLNGFDGDLFTFSAEHDGEAAGDADGVYLGQLGGDLQLLVEEAETSADGKRIEDVQGSLLDGDQISFGVLLDDNTSALYVAQVSHLPGDYNNDEIVDAADFTVWRDVLGQQVVLPNEADTLGVVTTEDYDVWRSHFGESFAGISVPVVPEPDFTILLVMLSGWTIGSGGRHVRNRAATSSSQFEFRHTSFSIPMLHH